MLFLLDRQRRPGRDPYLAAKLALFVAGAAAAVAGMVTGREWPITLAIALLALGLVLRFLPGRTPPEDE